MRCIAYHLDTGHRCHRPVGRSRSAADQYVCREHARSLFVALSHLPTARRRELAKREWNNVSELEGLR